MTHKMVMKEARAHTAEVDTTEACTRLEELCAGVPPEQERKLRRGTLTGQFLTVMPSEVSGTTLSAEEFRVGILLRLGMTPKGLPSLCDGCGAPFTVEHAHRCKKGGLVTSRHNEIRDTHIHLNQLATPASTVLSEPKIFTGREEQFVKGSVDGTVRGLNGRNVKVKWGKKGDMLVKNFWAPGTECIFDVQVTDTDQPSYLRMDPKKALETLAAAKKNKYLSACLLQRRHFTPLLISVDGLMESEGEAYCQRLASKLADKWQKPYSSVMGYVKSRLSIALVRAVHLTIMGSRIPATEIGQRRPLWEGAAGLALYRY